MNSDTIKKISIAKNAEEVFIAYETKTPLGTSQHEVTSTEPPTNAFKGAMQALRTTVLAILELPASFAEKIDIRGVTFKEDDKLGRGFIITAVLRMKYNAHAVINTPLKYECPEASQTPDKYLSVADIELIDALMASAYGYLQGERGEAAQTVMFPGASEVEAVPAGENEDGPLPPKMSRESAFNLRHIASASAN